MRFLADENFPGDAVRALRSAGHDVLLAGEDCPGSSDVVLLERAVAERRVLVTLDTDFGYLAFGAELPVDCGIVLFRMGQSPDFASRVVPSVLESRSDWAGQFAVVQEGRIRMRRLQPR